MQLDIFSKDDSILDTSEYSDFKEKLLASNCKKCTLHENRTNIVPDRGNPNSKIMVIGEGPGENEDLQGKAFVGRAGQLFDKIMASINIESNNQLLIANVVKCRPPGNRTPLKEEVNTCIPYLYTQISIIKPKLIILLGATALRHMDKSKKNFSMINEAGNIFKISEFPGIDFVVLYHPAFLLYDPRKKKDMWEHVKKLRKFIDENNII